MSERAGIIDRTFDCEETCTLRWPHVWGTAHPEATLADGPLLPLVRSLGTTPALSQKAVRVLGHTVASRTTVGEKGGSLGDSNHRTCEDDGGCAQREGGGGACADFEAMANEARTSLQEFVCTLGTIEETLVDELALRMDPLEVDTDALADLRQPFSEEIRVLQH